MEQNNNKITPPKRPSNLNFSTGQKSSKPMTELSKSTPTSLNIVSTERVPEKTVRAKSAKKVVIASLVVLLALIIAVSVTLILVFPNQKRVNDISISFEPSVVFQPVIAGAGQGEERQYVMPGDEVKCTFNIKSAINSKSDESVNLDVFVRFKFDFDTEDNYFSTLTLNFIDGDMWYKGVDGYYYLTKGLSSPSGVLSPGEEIEIIKGFYIDTALGNEFAGKTVRVNFDCQALQANYQAIVELWPTAPYQWASQYRNLI